ncbi:MAG TPA: glycosyltransferase family 4 protein [Candidatus Binataceae bacterium]|nr:glycosyltransferase family 4 protein [Candidatus Binataceae bacterium]
MRILLICEAFRALGGLREAVDSLAREYLARGHSVAVASVRAPYREDREIRSNVECFPIDVPRWKPVTWRHPERFFRRVEATELKKVLREWRPEVVNVHGGVWERFPTIIEACRSEQIPVVVSFQSASYSGTWGAKALASLRVASGLTAVSQAAKDYMQTLSPAMASAAVIPNGADFHVLSEAHPLKRNRPYLFCAARLFLEEKAVDLLIQALGLIAQDHPEIDLLIAGDGPDRGTLERMIGKLGLSNRVEMLGFKSQAELGSLYKGAQIFVMPSRFREGLPLVFLEAMAAGVPTVGSAIGGVPEAIRDGGNGLLLRENTSEELAGVLRRLLDDQSLRERMSLKALDLAQQFTWPVIAASYLETYSRAIEGR